MKAISSIQSLPFSIVALLCFPILTPAVTAADNRPPTILDTDYGSFIDDIFAVGLLLQSTDVLDPRLILTTAEEPEWSAHCVSEQISRSDLGLNLPVAIGETLPPYSERGTVCGVPGLVGFALADTCASPREGLPPPIPDGVAHAANMIEASDRDDWMYIAIGGQTSLQKLIRDHPQAIAKIRNLVVMGGNFCTGFDAYPDVPTPTAETNIGCDMVAANFVLEAAARATLHQQHFPDIYYVPVVTVEVLSGDDYKLVRDASRLDNESSYSPAAHATIDFYDAWSAAARASPHILVYKEAWTFDPATESTPQFDAVAVLVAMDVACGKAGSRVAQHTFANGIHFVTNPEAEAAHQHSEFFRRNPPPSSAHTLWSGDEAFADGHSIGQTKCEALTPHHFDITVPPPHQDEPLLPPVTIRAALGFVSDETRKDFFHEMAVRLSGRFPQPGQCDVSSSTLEDPLQQTISATVTSVLRREQEVPMLRPVTRTRPREKLGLLEMAYGFE